VHQLDSVVQINSNAAEESSGSALKLKDQAQSLYRLTTELKSIVSGAAAQPSHEEAVKDTFKPSAEDDEQVWDKAA
jgi:hypothetical protein